MGDALDAGGVVLGDPDGPEQQPLRELPERSSRVSPAAEVAATAAPGSAPDGEPEEPEDDRSCKEKTLAITTEYRAKLSVLPFWWKIIWVVVLLLWVPFAYTIAAPIPGSMWLFLVGWTTTVLRCAGHAEEEVESGGGGEMELELTEVGEARGKAQQEKAEGEDLLPAASPAPAPAAGS